MLAAQLTFFGLTAMFERAPAAAEVGEAAAGEAAAARDADAAGREAAGAEAAGADARSPVGKRVLGHGVASAEAAAVAPPPASLSPLRPGGGGSCSGARAKLWNDWCCCDWPHAGAEVVGASWDEAEGTELSCCDNWRGCTFAHSPPVDRASKRGAAPVTGVRLPSSIPRPSRGAGLAAGSGVTDTRRAGSSSGDVNARRLRVRYSARGSPPCSHSA